jgi:hypothetical protein
VQRLCAVLILIVSFSPSTRAQDRSYGRSMVSLLLTLHEYCRVLGCGGLFSNGDCLEVFNITNSVRYDVRTNAAGSGPLDNGSADGPSLGAFSSTLTAPRVQQFSLRLTF